MPFKKILIIRFSSIGDVVLTTPIIRCIKKQLNAEIHFLIKPEFAHIVTNNSNVDKVHRLHKSITESISIMQEEKFDLVIDLQKNLNSYRIKNGLKCASVTFDKLNLQKWLLVNLKINKLPEKHLVDRYFDALQPIGVIDDGMGLDYFILPEDEYDAIGLVEGVKYDILVLGANYFTKRIPVSKCEEIISLSTGHTVLLGGEDVSNIANQLSTKYPQKTINLCGKVGLGVSAGIIKHARKVITGDTGLMHIAAALQKEIYLLWGNTTPLFGMYPYYGFKNPSNYRNYEVLNLPCRPCSKLGYDHCPKGHFRCMLDIDVSSI
ncbi:MAG: glycosyltransferase family 9 protein [Saprospiraceae bacterium]|nr:glycosyltransferase family 9 protein [Saprospiraceae bacterium]